MFKALVSKHLIPGNVTMTSILKEIDGYKSPTPNRVLPARGKLPNKELMTEKGKCTAIGKIYAH